MVHPFPLPRGLVPLPGEGLAGFLLRLAHRTGVSPGEIALRGGLTHKAHSIPARHLLMLEPDRLETFTFATRLSHSQAERLTLRALADRHPPITEALTRPSAGSQQRPRGFFPPWTLGTSTRYCPQCLAGDDSEIQRRHGGPWRSQWRLAAAIVCPMHQVFLEDICPSCRETAHSGHRPRPSDSRTAFLRLLAAPGTRGLHPAQCRNGTPGQPPCGTRLDAPELFRPGIRPTDALVGLQNRILSEQPALALPASVQSIAFIDLQIIAALVCATWPAAATVSPQPMLVGALDAHIRSEQARDANLLTPTQRSYRWAVPPTSAIATAGLMDISARLLALPPVALEAALAALLEKAPWPSVPGWGKTWTLVKHRSSPSLRDHFRRTRPTSFPGKSAARSIRRRSQQAPAPRQVSFGPENIPQWIPDEWFALLLADTSRHAMVHSIGFRRFSALQLVQLASGMDAHQAADYLAVPWDRAEQVRRMSAGSRFQHAPDVLPQAFTELADRISSNSILIDYRERREQFAGWSITVGEWSEIASCLDALGPRTRFQLGERMHDAASTFLWSRLTGSEWRLAPSVRGRRPGARDRLTGTGNSVILNIAQPPPRSIRFAELNRILTSREDDLLNQNDTCTR
ncbi:TniQ family protein [Streptomyces goshikiensis]|uniref:TniQ family protein n=1 Tax=Streptomyces goshikiensis TaxID=1942 RepID=UPI00370F95C2